MKKYYVSVLSRLKHTDIIRSGDKVNVHNMYVVDSESYKQAVKEALYLHHVNCYKYYVLDVIVASEGKIINEN
jgi:hypothetical protein